MKTILFTDYGYKQLKAKLDTEMNKRPGAVIALQKGRDMGDLSENGLYKAAKMELSNIDRQIRYLKHLLKYGKPTAPKDNSTIQFGHFVTIEDKTGRKTYQIVGEYEANPGDYKISFISPLGKNLLGKGIGNKIHLKTIRGMNEYLIIKIA